MKKTVLILFALLLVCALGMTAFAADTRPVVRVGEGSGIKLDGVREDCYGEPVEVAKAGVAHNADFPLTTATLSVAWEGNTLYYYIEVRDTTPNAVSPNFWEVDGVEFVVDLLDTRALTYPGDNTVARFAILTGVDDTNAYFLFPYMLDHVTADQIDWYFTPQDEWEGRGGYVLECSFESPVDLEDGAVMGFDVQIYDDQSGEGHRDSQTYLEDTSDTFHYCPANLGARLVLGNGEIVSDGEDAEETDDRVVIQTGYGEAVLDGEKDACYGEAVKIEKAGISHNADCPLTTADISFSWAGDKIWAYAAVADTTPNAVSGNFWQCDGLELLYDLLDTRANTYPSDSSVARFAVLPENTPDSPYASNYFLATASEEQIQYFYKRTADGYILEVEFTVPESVSGKLQGGASVGFDAQIYDDQFGNGNRDSQTFFGNTEDIIGQYPAVFGGKLILAQAPADAEPAPAEPETPAEPTYTYPASGESGNALVGTVIGNETGWGGNADAGAAAAFDGNPATFFDPLGQGDGYCGMDMGRKVVLDKVVILSRTDWNARFMGAEIRGNNEDNVDTAVTLWKSDVEGTNPDYFVITDFENNDGYQYYFYYNTANHGDVAEVEFYGTDAPAEEEAPAPETPAEETPAEEAPAEEIPAEPETSPNTFDFGVIAAVAAVISLAGAAAAKKKH